MVNCCEVKPKPLCKCCDDQMKSLLRQISSSNTDTSRTLVYLVLNDGTMTTVYIWKNAVVNKSILIVYEAEYLTEGEKEIAIPIPISKIAVVLLSEIASIRIKTCTTVDTCDTLCEKQMKEYLEYLNDDFKLNISINSETEIIFEEGNIIKLVSGMWELRDKVLKVVYEDKVYELGDLVVYISTCKIDSISIGDLPEFCGRVI